MRFLIKIWSVISSSFRKLKDRVGRRTVKEEPAKPEIKVPTDFEIKMGMICDLLGKAEARYKAAEERAALVRKQREQHRQKMVEAGKKKKFPPPATAEFPATGKAHLISPRSSVYRKDTED